MFDVLVLTLLLQVRYQSPSCTVGEGWSFVVQQSSLDNSSLWQEQEDAPRLAPRAAIRSARALLARLSCKDANDWEVSQVGFRRVSPVLKSWLYVVSLQEPIRVPKGSVVGAVSPRFIEIPVLLDGTAVTPSVGAWPARR